MSILEKRFKNMVTYIVLAVAAACCLLFFLFYGYYTLPQTITPQVESEALGYASYYNELYTAGKIDKNSQSLALLAGSGKLPRSIYYFDEHDVLLAVPGMNTAPLTATRDTVAHLLNQAQHSNQLATNYDRRILSFELLFQHYLISCQPSIVNGKYIGATVIFYNANWIRSAVISAIIQYFCFTVIICVILSLLARRYIKRLLMNIETIADYLRAVASGKPGQEALNIKTGDELELIADGINRYNQLETAKNTHLQEFSANVAHQLRTPLAAIQTSTEVIELLNKNEKIAEMTAIIINNVELAQDTTTALLLLARVDNYLQGEKLPLEECDLDRIIRKEIDLIVQRGEPATRFDYTRRDDCNIYAVPALLSEVVRNLLLNAVKYSPAGSCIVVALQAEESALKLTVRDRGTGITESDHKHIFERFYRGQTTRHFKGSGLGLALPHAIVTLFHGEITVENNPDCGVTFTVMLPT